VKEAKAEKKPVAVDCYGRRVSACEKLGVKSWANVRGCGRASQKHTPRPPGSHSAGTAESVHAVPQQRQAPGVGMVAGAVLGGVLGNQVGGGNGRKLATVAGAVGGGYAGNEIEKRTRATTTYNVRVRMEDGEVRTFPYEQQPNWSAGDRVRVVNGQLTSRA